MSQSSKEKNSNITFRRIRGRIVPIVVGGAGAAIAADAARTKRVYQKGDVAVDVKKFAYQPFRVKFGKRAVIYKKGKKAGFAAFFDDAAESTKKAKVSGFSWFGIKRKYRKQGLGDILSAESAKEMRRSGTRFLSSQVVHPGSVKTNYSKKRDDFFRIHGGKKGTYSVHLTKSKALREIKNIRDKGYITSNIWRETDLKGIKTKSKYSRVFRTKSNKARILLGTTAAIGGIYGALRNER